MIFAAVPDSRQVKIINGTLYTTLNGPDGVFLGVPSGIFSFVDSSGDPLPLPESPKSRLHLVVQADPNYSKIAGFDMNRQGTIAFTADAEKGIQKYVKSDSGWKFAYNFSIPQNIPAARITKLVVSPLLWISAAPLQSSMPRPWKVTMAS